MSLVRDYDAWHNRYDDPDSDLSWRLRTVQRYIIGAVDRSSGPLTILSSCAGDGRDLLGVMARRDDTHRFRLTLIELHPVLAGRARSTAAARMPAATVDVRSIDAGTTDAYAGAVPAHLVLLVGIFGNISHDDLARTIAAAPEFCKPGATLLWSRGRKSDDLNDEVRRRFNDAGFREIDYDTLETGSRPAVGAMRYDGEPMPLEPERRLFTFLR